MVMKTATLLKSYVCETIFCIPFYWPASNFHLSDMQPYYVRCHSEAPYMSHLLVPAWPMDYQTYKKYENITIVLLEKIKNGEFKYTAKIKFLMNATSSFYLLPWLPVPCLFNISSNKYFEAKYCESGFSTFSSTSGVGISMA